MKGTLIDGFELTTEKYRKKFRGSKKDPDQSWVDFVDCSVKTIGGWVTGNEVTDYEGLYNLLMKEHILSNCPSEKLHQYLVDTNFNSPQELAKKADKWMGTSVPKKSQENKSE